MRVLLGDRHGPRDSMPCSECDGAAGGGLRHGGLHGKHGTTGYATVIEGSSYGTPQIAVCQSCGGGGCGLCKGNGWGAGRGLFHHGDPNGYGNSLCDGCGGRGCGLCGGSGRGPLASAHGMLASLKGKLLGKLTHAGQIQYFVGPGGPVPITPGYVPYINVTRSPRDYFAFPPFADNVP